MDVTSGAPSGIARTASLHPSIYVIALLVTGCARVVGNASTCGDGACNGMETCSSCPADCVTTGLSSGHSIAFDPSAGATVSGVTTFTVDVSSEPAVAAVRFAIGSRQLGVVTSPPYSLAWNTGYTSDGSHEIEATTISARGEILGSASLVVDIDNHGGGLTIDSPDLTQTLRGTVPFTATAKDKDYYPARWNVFLDGIQVGMLWTDHAMQNQYTVTSALDTTVVPNGRHELHIDVGSNFWPDGQQVWHNYRASTVRSVTIDNGHTLMAIVGNHQHVYLRPGESLALGCSQRFTDGTAGPCSAPSYDSDPVDVVTVDAAGLATAGAGEGFATVTIRDSGKTATVYVWVSSDTGVPHFSGNGAMLTSYQNGRSIFVVAPFDSSPEWLMRYPALDAEMKRAGINTLSTGFYLNPRNTTVPYASWQSSQDAFYGPWWTWAANNGYHLYLTGDDIARSIGGDAWFTLNWADGRRALQHAMESASQVAIALDVIDEGSMLWGWTPTPRRKIGEPTMLTSVTCTGSSCEVTWPGNPVKPGRFFAGVDFAFTGSSQPGLNTPNGQMFTATNITDGGFKFNLSPAKPPVYGTFTVSNDPDLEFLWWAGSAGGCPRSPCDPPIPNTALATIADWLRTARLRVPISWPALGIAPPIVHSEWAGKASAVSDFTSHFWDSLQPGRTYSWGTGVAERVRWMRDAFYSRQNYLMARRPQVMLSGMASFFYQKQTPGEAYYHPPADNLLQPGVTGNSVVAELMTAAALGNAGVRLYKFESQAYEAPRAASPVGSVHETGVNPLLGDAFAPEIWRAVAYASNLLTKRLAPFVLGRALSSPGLASDVVTAARRGTDGALLMATNGRDGTRPLTLDLTGYRTGEPISRYLVGATGIRTALLTDRANDSVMLGAGESVIYLFPDAGVAPYLTSVTIPRPVLPTGSHAAFIHHGYVYEGDLALQTDGVECTYGCTLRLDPSIGVVYRQFVFTDCAGRVTGRSEVGTVPLTPPVPTAKTTGHPPASDT